MTLFKERGVVLRSYRLGEADRIVVFLTESHGKVRAVAKGVRRTTSKFGARLEPMSHVLMLLWAGRGDLDIVKQVEIVDHFPVLRGDLGRLTRGLSLIEVAEQMAQERHSDPRLYSMLVGALRVLDDTTRDPAMVAPSFFLKALVLDGAEPVLDGCASCGLSGDHVKLVAFSLPDGGALCSNCRRGRPLSAPALELMRRILGGTLGNVLSGPAPVGTEEVTLLTTEAVESHLERRLRSVRSATGI
ncbi:MAG: DNA repair protein RecO [Actinomycetota bacterium]|nr:DNA repair protein RecO [Actinomycetota bacterium]